MSAQDPKSNPQGPGGTATAEAPASEVEGRKRNLALYTCWSCGSPNYVDPAWTWFACWHCGAIKSIGGGY